jgi:type I restriction enzyme M protein
MLASLNEKGRMAVVVPHGVLFRGASEGRIRKEILDNNLLDAVIGLPSNLFFGTSIPACVMVFKKQKNSNDVLFIDASNEFEKEKNQNKLTEANLQKIVDTYNSREQLDKYSHIATLEEIKENDYNLNIPRYVDTFEEEEPVDIEATKQNIIELEAKREVLKTKMAEYLKELGV